MTGEDPDFALDEEAVAQGKADDQYTFTRMDQVSPAEFAPAIQVYWGDLVRACFDGYREQIAPDAQLLTKNVAAEFHNVRNVCNQAREAEATVVGVLDSQARSRMTVEGLIAGIPRWITPELESVSTDGNIDDRRMGENDATSDLFWLLYHKRNEASVARAQAPQGVDLPALLASWRELAADTNLDNEFLRPVTFPDGAVLGDRIFNYLRAAFPLDGLRLVETRDEAIDGFANAGEGPDGDDRFDSISDALKKDSIKKRFYFSMAGDVSSNVLIVVDEHSQAWGFQMGYSE